jgi:hypothetical protein
MTPYEFGFAVKLAMDGLDREMARLDAQEKAMREKLERVRVAAGAQPGQDVSGELSRNKVISATATPMPSKPGLPKPALPKPALPKPALPKPAPPSSAPSTVRRVNRGAF